MNDMNDINESDAADGGGTPAATGAGRPAPPDFRPAAEAVARLLPAVTDDGLGAPTPCPDYSVRELLGHLVMLTTAFRDTARKELGPTTDTDPNSARPVLDPDWRAVLPRRLDEVAEAWSDPAAWQGTTRAGGVTLPAPVAGMVALNEIVVHGWDLARATGQPYDPPQDALGVSYELLAATGDDDPMRGVIFGPIVPVEAGAPLLDRVVGLSGRRPSWPR
ncbi:TIGR03086 family metal-binding protein [Streptomyces sp. NPDC047315]|uniref:TIGR03086 family metal-binding protein n=1 Tax=Streptomyces sp. NPDC047315 TaxID=3155142 RepID=UPI0033C9C299